MKRVLIVQPSMQPPGGGNGVAAWVLQALVPVHRVTVLSWRPVELESINRYYGTALRSSDFDTIVVPRSWRALPDLLPVPASLLKNALLMRYTRKVSAGFDAIFGVYNETDYGRRGIQYIHYPTYLRPRPANDLRWYHGATSLLRLYYSAADRIADFSLDRLESNLTLVNSDWTGERVSSFLNVKTNTLYPPVVDPAPGAPWSERRNGFLAVGRYSPEKEYERMIRILARVRETVPDITLTIVGGWDNRRTRQYYESLQRLAAAQGSWIQFRRDVSRADLRQLTATHRYGIHGMRDEHFGMAPAEMARAGMIVWVPRGGGQVEVVGNEPSLTYDSDDDAVKKIVHTMRDEHEQQRLLAHLARVTDQFSIANFTQHVRDIVDTFTP